MCHDLVGEIDKTHRYYREQIDFLKQQFKIALKTLRPNIIPSESLELLFDEVEMTSEVETEPEIKDEKENDPKKNRRKGKRKAIPEHLARTIVEHDLAEENKICDKDGSKLKRIGYDVKEELKYTPPKYEVIEHRYHKYGCEVCHEGIKREKPEPTLIPGSYASSELLSHIAVSKYCNHLPLYRQEKMFARDGIFITRAVMSDWMIRLGEALNPLIGIMHEKILESEVVHGDETPVRILTKDGVRTSSQAYMWQISRWGSTPLILFEYNASRKKEVALKLLGSYSGYIQIDGYAGYDTLFGENSLRIRVGCMAHVLRKFKNFLQTLPKESRKGHAANEIVELINSLYDIEKPLKTISLEERCQKRLESDANIILEDLMDFIAQEKQSVSTDSPYFAALRYANDELPYIRNYLKHGLIEIDNNLAENAIRPFALGRRNWLFICAEKGAEASANIYSILTTAKANNVEPFSCLTKLNTKLPYCVNAQDYEDLLSIVTGE